MDGIKLYHNIILSIFLQVFMLNTLACKENYPHKTMPLINLEIGYELDKMIDVQKDFL